MKTLLRKKLWTLFSGAAFLCMAGSVAWAEDAEKKDTYPLKNCPVSGQELGENAVTKTIDGREVRFCCGGCPAKFEADKEASFKKMDEAIVAAEKEDYPLDTCAVSGEKLGSMGDPVDVVVDNRLVRLCCAGCEKKLRKDPETYISKIDAAAKAKEDSEKAEQKS